MCTARGGTVINSPAATCVSPSGVMNTREPGLCQYGRGMTMLVSLESEITFGYQEKLVVEAMPVHRRSRSTRRKLEDDTAYAVVGAGAVLENIAGQWPKPYLLRCLFLVQLDRSWTSVRRHRVGELRVFSPG